MAHFSNSVRTLFLTADLRQGNVVKPGSVDLIVTSPPYANANDYHLYHRFRLFWLGFDPRKLAKKEIGSHLRHQKEQSGIQEYLEEMEQCLGHMIRGLRPGRFAVMVVGDSLFSGKLSHTAGLLGERAKKVGFGLLEKLNARFPNTGGRLFRQHGSYARKVYWLQRSPSLQ